MKEKRLDTLKILVLTIFVAAGAGLVGVPKMDRCFPLAGTLVATLALMPFFLAVQAPLGIRAASAESHHGIRGQQAPELDLDTWIDGRGVETTPIQLGAYRGKVIYLYFFQDW